MRCSNYLFSVILVLIVLLTAAVAAEAQTSGPLSTDISFKVSMPKPYTHLFDVEMSVRIPANLQTPNDSDLLLPVWTPGSYLIREYERHVQDFAAYADTRALEWTKV